MNKKQGGAFADPRIYLLLSIVTIGGGIVLALLWSRTPDSEPVQKMVYLIAATALLPAGVLWTLEHYFLARPIEQEYESVILQYKEDQQLLSAIQTVRENHFRAIGAQRAPLAKQVLTDALRENSSSEIVICGSTLNGLFRQDWFEQFVRDALQAKKELRLMFTHWDYVTHREKQEDRRDGDIAGELQHSLALALKWGVQRESIRLVRGAPTVFMIMAGNNMLLNPYPFGRESVTSMTIWLKNPLPAQPDGPPGSIWRSYYENHYHAAWHPELHKRRLSTIPEEISEVLPEDWMQQLEKFIGGVVSAHLRRDAASAGGT